MLEIVRYEGPSDGQWLLTIGGMRNSWESWEKGDSDLRDFTFSWDFVLGENDKALALKLVKAGADHGKFMRQLPVIVDIKAPNYWWREFDTYRIGIEASDITQNSTSMMHVLGKEEFKQEHFCFEDMPQEATEQLLSLLNTLRDRWIAAGKRKGPEQKEWRAMLQAIPDSWIYQRTVSLNYQVLRAIYHSRKNHRLSEWRTFCTWIEGLENSFLITEK